MEVIVLRGSTVTGTEYHTGYSVVCVHHLSVVHHTHIGQRYLQNENTIKEDHKQLYKIKIFLLYSQLPLKHYNF